MLVSLTSVSKTGPNFHNFSISFAANNLHMFSQKVIFETANEIKRNITTLRKLQTCRFQYVYNSLENYSIIIVLAKASDPSECISERE